VAATETLRPQVRVNRVARLLTIKHRLFAAGSYCHPVPRDGKLEMEFCGRVDREIIDAAGGRAWRGRYVQWLIASGRWGACFAASGTFWEYFAIHRVDFDTANASLP
jgi:hypothetical protein